MNYYLHLDSTNKAKLDVDCLLAAWGYTDLAPRRQGSGGVAHFLTKSRAMLTLWHTLKAGDTLFLQYPMKKFYRLATRIARHRGARVVTLIHDLGAFRRKKITAEDERRLFDHTDFLIAHNRKMCDYLVRTGNPMPVVPLEIFDYLTEVPLAAKVVPTAPWKIVFAGGLGAHRSGFLQRLGEEDIPYDLDLYGPGLEAEATFPNGRIRYHGMLPSDAFIRDVNAHFGLVWDGASLDACTGAWGEYLKINNPHKTSFYLRAGLPVIVWRQAAMADFVGREGLGLIIDRLQDLPEALQRLSSEEYAEMRRRAAACAERLQKGYYLRTAIDQFDNQE